MKYWRINKINKFIIIDERIRNIEKDFFENLGYKIITLKKSDKTYSEISSHSDIFISQIDKCIVVEKSRFEFIKNNLDFVNIIKRK